MDRNDREHRLINYDWKYKLVLSSDSAAKLNKPLLQLELILETRDKSIKNLALELDREEVLSLINKLNSVEQLS